jgi:RNA polymerase sigma-70 factor (ECF subfamily)
MATNPDGQPCDGELEGGGSALSLFAEAHRPALTAYVARRLGDLLRSKVEPEDIVQETLAVALRDLEGGNFNRRDPFGWLCHLADQRIVDAYRRYVRSQKRSAAREVRPAPRGDDSSRPNFSQMLQASLTTPSAACVRNEQQDQLAAALATLPQEQRDALQMHFLEGLPSKEIAQRLGKEDVAVRVMLSRGVQKLRRLMDRQ